MSKKEDIRVLFGEQASNNGNGKAMIYYETGSELPDRVISLIRGLYGISIQKVEPCDQKGRKSSNRCIVDDQEAGDCRALGYIGMPQLGVHLGRGLPVFRKGSGDRWFYLRADKPAQARALHPTEVNALDTSYRIRSEAHPDGVQFTLEEFRHIAESRRAEGLLEVDRP
jgi:hypothetical protein